MPKPGALTLRVLTRGDEYGLTGLRSVAFAKNAIPNRSIAGGVPCRRVFRNTRDQFSHFLHPASGEHDVESRFDPVGKNWPRIDDKIARSATCRAALRNMKSAQAMAAEQRYLDRAEELGPPEMRALRIERCHPALQFRHRIGTQ